MDGRGNFWHYSNMTAPQTIPVFTLFGETSAFPDVVHCERIWDRAPLHDWEIAPHRHHVLVQVLHMRSGAATVRIDGRESSLTDGEFLFVPAGIVHAFRFQRGCEGLVLSFPLSVVAGLAAGAPEVQRALQDPFAGPAPDLALILMEQLRDSFASAGSFRAAELLATSHLLLVTLAAARAEEPQEANPASRYLREFDTQILNHMAEGWGVTQHARALGITTGHLNRICRGATGQTASHRIESAVMTEAARLLAFTRLPAAEIGFELGFDDPSYFSRRFRHLRGESPSAYRRRVAG